MQKKRKRKCSEGRYAWVEDPGATMWLQCKHNATVKRGRRYYCHRHDPVRLLLREMSRLQIWNHTRAAEILRIGEGRL